MIHLRYAGTHLCGEHFLRFFEERAKTELGKQGRMPKGITAVALSGGKDSVSLLYFLHKLAQGNPDLRLHAVTVDEGIAGYRGGAIAIAKEVCAQLGVPHSIVSTHDLAGYSIDAYAAGARGPARTENGGVGEDAPGTPRPACGACGVFRRAGMNKLAREAGAAAIATGHNLDDQAQTILMNHLKGDLDRLARLAPHGPDEVRHEGLVRRLMPFRTIPDKEVLLYAVLSGLPIHQSDEGLAECPYAARSHRFALRDMLVQLEELHPGTRHALVRGQERLKPILAAALPPIAVASCPECGEPTSGQRCVACSLRAPPKPL